MTEPPSSPPVVPGLPDGQQSPPADSASPPSLPTSKRRWWPAVISGMVVLLIGAGVAVFLLLRKDSPVTPLAQPVPTTAGPTALRTAYESCGRVGEISDGDRTLFLDMRGEEAGSGVLSISDITCILGGLNTPSYVIHEMEQTRALDGRQSETWGDFEASWSYHPDDGLDVLIRER